MFYFLPHVPTCALSAKSNVLDSSDNKITFNAQTWLEFDHARCVVRAGRNSGNAPFTDSRKKTIRREWCNGCNQTLHCQQSRANLRCRVFRCFPGQWRTRKHPVSKWRATFCVSTCPTRQPRFQLGPRGDVDAAAVLRLEPLSSEGFLQTHCFAPVRILTRRPGKRPRPPRFLNATMQQKPWSCTVTTPQPKKRGKKVSHKVF